MKQWLWQSFVRFLGTTINNFKKKVERERREKEQEGDEREIGGGEERWRERIHTSAASFEGRHMTMAMEGPAMMDPARHTPKASLPCPPYLYTNQKRRGRRGKRRERERGRKRKGGGRGEDIEPNRPQIG